MKQSIFSSYTGSPFLNNALYTIEALAKLKNVSDITPDLLLKGLKRHALPELNKRLKSYTMLFTNNGPLFQPSEGREDLYEKLLEKILISFESEGEHLCEISGLRFGKTFSDIYRTTLLDLGCDPDKPDTSINRVWWPLIGSLGSDAQGLPQAKYMTMIHPVCVAILQFLPLSTRLYRGRALLIDSINHEFAREFTAESVKDIEKHVSLTSGKSPVDNVSYSKGEYLLQALKELKNYQQEYGLATDFNLWSYTNSGTGASCEIDRVPSELIQKLLQFYNDFHTKSELQKILSGKGTAGSFLYSLETNSDWTLLYPAKNYDGVSIEFFEKYQTIIGNGKRLNLLSYAAGLLNQHSTEREKTEINKSDSYAKEREQYHVTLNRVLLEATKKKQWDLSSHIQILDYPDQLPVRNSFYRALKIIHFYYQKKKFASRPSLQPEPGIVARVVSMIVDVIQADSASSRTVANLLDERSWEHVGLNRILCEAADRICFEDVYTVLYSNGYRQHKGLFHLLQIFFAYPLPIGSGEMSDQISYSYPFVKRFEEYAEIYFKYYDEERGLSNFKRNVLEDFPPPKKRFYYWLNETWNRITKYLSETISKLPETDARYQSWKELLGENMLNGLPNVDELTLDEEGKENLHVSQFAIRFYLHQQYYIKSNKKRKTA